MSDPSNEELPLQYRIFDAALTPVLITGENWRICYANNAVVDLFEIPGEDLVEAHLNLLPHFADLPAFFDQVADNALLEDEFRMREIWLAFTDGRHVDILIQHLSMFFPGDTRLVWRFQRRTAFRALEMPVDESAEMYRNLVELASDGICIIQDEAVCYANPQLCDMIGVSADELVGTRFVDHIDADDIGFLRQLYYRHQAGARDIGVVPIRALHRDGHSVDVEVDASVIPFQGRTATLVTLHDVSETLRAKRALVISEAKYRLVTENTTDIIWSFDLSTRRFNFFSQAAERVLGYVPEVDEVNLVDVFDLDTARWVAMRYDKLIEQWPERRNVTFEIEHRSKDGKVVWLEVQGTLVAEGRGDKPTAVVGVSRDVTQRHEAARLLVESEERYRQLVAASPDSVAVVVDSKVVFVNEAGARMYGVESPKDVLGISVLDLVVKDQQDIARGRISEVVDDGLAAPPRQFRAKRLDGSVFDVELTSVPFRFDGRAAVLMIGRDITHRLETEKTLAYRLELVILIAEIATRFVSMEPSEIDDGVTEALRLIGEFIDCHRGYVYQFRQAGAIADNTHEWAVAGVPPEKENQQNLSFAERFSWSGEFYMAKKAFVSGDIDNLPDDAAAERELFREQNIKALVSVPMVYGDTVAGFIGFDDLHRKRDWDEGTIALLRTVGVVIINALMRQRIDRQLHESEETARTLIDTSEASAVLVDRQGRIVAVNHLAASTLDEEPESLVGRDSLSLVPPALLAKTQEVNEMVRQSGESFQAQYEFGDRWYLVDVNPVLDENDEVGRLGVFARDITELKKQEVDLREALRLARESEVLKSRFLANMSHEVRTPLNHIIGLTSVLLIQPDMPDDEREGYLRIIKQGGQSMLSLLTAILDLSKIESGKTEPTLATFELAPWIDQLAERYSTLAANKNLRFELKTDRNLPAKVVGDATMMEQVLGNLIDNAVKFTTRGSVGLHLNAVAPAEGMRDLIFVVEDSGIGVAADMREKIFESFFQVDGSSTREYHGAGLGLTICSELAGMLGGDLSVESWPGEGSAFTFRCPVREPDF
jgi:two-component system, sensor histidine kinase and response regulator